MEDSDVICLSSDDEFSQDELPLKNQKTRNAAPLTAKIEPKEKPKDAINSTLKRKLKESDDSTKPKYNLTKKPKIKSSHIEEITIESPTKEPKKESTTFATNADLGSKLKIDVLKSVIENGTITINKIPAKKSHSTSGKSKESNGKIADHTKSRNLKSDSEKTARIVVNPVAKLREANSASPTSTMREVVNNFFDNMVEEIKEGEKSVGPFANLRIEMPTGITSAIVPDKNAIETRPTSGSEVKRPKTQTRNDEKSSKRITPQLLSESSSKIVEFKGENIRKSLTNSRLINSKESNAKIANTRDEKSVSINDTNSNAKERKSMDFESKPGCSKSPDKKKSSSSVFSLKHKSTSPRNDEKNKKISEDATSKSVEFVPQPGCSKSSGDMDEKPRLIVVDKKPILHNSEDTFSMFLSLCLQTDRCPDMEKVVAKLKRYYDELNPAYAASDAFRDTLNEKRELIALKGKKAVYHYVQLLKNDMKAKKRIPPRNGDDQAEELEEIAQDNAEEEEEEDSDEARRVRHKIKRIEKAMKECQKKIKKYEEAEINFDDENNSHYIKLDRFKERMVELYTQMCKYTHEHPDAGRAYLRPKHLRVTQIPSIDQAINSFINSKLAINKMKIGKGKSFVDGLIFPDYVDILECVEKVNKEQDLKLNKRAMQSLAEKAFTQMGKHLQEARQHDYWDTFSLNLDKNADPAASDADLLEKLSNNKKLAEENEKKVFEEFVRRQEEGKADDEDEAVSDEEDEDEDDEQDDLEDKSNDKSRDRDDNSDVEMSSDDESDPESIHEDDQDNSKALEGIVEVPEDDKEEVEDNTKDISKNNNLETTSEKLAASSSTSPKKSSGTSITTIEVTLDDVDTEDGENEPMEEEKAHQLLRIRSFAKQPDSWQSSQQSKDEETMNKETKSLESSEEEISVVSFLPGRDKKINNLNNNAKAIVTVATNKTTAIKSGNVVKTTSNLTNKQTPKYIKIATGIMRPVQLSSAQIQNNVKNLKIVAVSRPPRLSTLTGKPLGRAAPTATSTPIKQSQLQIRPCMPLQNTNQLQVLRLNNGKCVPTSVASRPQNPPRFVALTTSTPIQSSQMPPRLSAVRLQGPRILQRPLISNPQALAATSTPVNANSQQNKTAVTAAQLPQLQVLRLNNGKYLTCPAPTSKNPQNSREQQVARDTQQQVKATSIVTNVLATSKGTNNAGFTLPVLKPRINDNVQTVQQQRTNVARVTRPGDQNRRTSESEPKRKNEPS